ncbi:MULTISPECIES: dihydrofolate reductase family protein [unclassified Nesterenkonia]|uniref:dihydrofolate reductase family protein n=1 Tax=unclassified Nesterenkonia TaxID=2629769 RepID=UPI0008720C42|nr:MULTISPECIES: dihydrofolate reductase family protein [unclassified Nesterenkonia]MDS2173070.1 dihydrofolate reductase family protein [Nesterenkonia sp. CL21]OSM43116.1 deaminase [Nesterenkonia sp. PF2B19]
MLLISMSTSLDGFTADRTGDFSWGAPDEELFRFHLDTVRGLGACLCGRRLYETMLPWETDPLMRENALGAEFADVWAALPKIVFSRSLDQVEGNARLAQRSLAEEIPAVLAATEQDVEIGGPTLAAQAVELGLVEEYQIFRHPIILGGGTPLLPPVDEAVPLELVESRVFGGRVVYERYRRAEGSRG